MRNKRNLVALLLLVVIALGATFYFKTAEAKFNPKDLRWHVTIDGEEHVLKPLVMKDVQVSETVEDYRAQLKRYKISPTAKITAKFPKVNAPIGTLSAVTKDKQLVSNIPLEWKVTLNKESGEYYLSAKAIYGKEQAGRQVVLLFGCIVEK